MWNSAPALAELLAEIVTHRPEIGRVPLRVLLLSGDWIRPELLLTLRNHWPEAALIALGGATEASIWSNAYEVTNIDPAWKGAPYGVPLANQTMRVLDGALRLRPPWATGQICIGGAGLARGYRNAPDLTAEQFIQHPDTGERLYLTGDLGRYRPDGVIEFLGRRDGQLKIQGFRVELGEIEAVVRTHPDVRNCLVVQHGGPSGQPVLCALMVPRQGAVPEPGAVSAFLRERLPRYLVPARIRLVESLPLTANGKVDLARAAALAESAAPSREAVVSGDGLTARMCGVWQKVLSVKLVEPDEDFFALGGTSLLGLRMVHTLRAEFGVDLSLGELFEARTPGSLARSLVSGGQRALSCAVSVADRPGERVHLFHPVGGSITPYTGFADQWPGPVWAFQSRGLLSGVDVADRDVESMAERYRWDIELRQPFGPYLLGGWSMGGVIAHEVAAQLARAGQQCRVFLIDSDCAAEAPVRSEAESHAAFLQDLAGYRLGAEAFAAMGLAEPGCEAVTAFDFGVTHGVVPAELGLSGYRSLMQLHALNQHALTAYDAAPSDHPTLLLAAGVNAVQDVAAGWRAVCRQLEVNVLPYDHYSIVRPEAIARVVEIVCGWIATR